MADAEKKSRPPMPDDYIPKKKLEFMPLDFDLQRGFQMLDDEQAGALTKRLLAYAVDYSNSYDTSLSIDTTGLSDVACLIADMAQGKIQRRADVHRQNSYARSDNGGGRPSKQ